MEMMKNEKKNGNGTEKPGREALTKAMQEERVERAQACQKEIEAILKKYDCGLLGVPGFDAEGRVKVQVQIGAR